MFSPTESFHTERRCFFTVYFLASCDLGGLIVCDNYHVGIRPGLTYITANTALHSHWQPEREAWAKIIKAIFSLKNVIIWNIMMAVNSWLITIKRRIKLPLVPPGGTAAISALEHYYTNQGWLACCLNLPSSHLTSPHLTFSLKTLVPALSRNKQKLDYDEIWSHRQYKFPFLPLLTKSIFSSL